MRLSEILARVDGMNLPRVRSTFVDWTNNIITYDVEVTDWQFTLRVPMPQLAVLLLLDLRYKNFSPDLHREHAEAYIRDFQVRAQDAFAYALSSFNSQDKSIREYFEFRFGEHLSEAREQAHRWWLDLATS